MRVLLALCLLYLSTFQVHGQEAEIRAEIDKFFRNFRMADTAALRSQFTPAAQLMTYRFDSKGNPRAKGELVDDFIRGLGLVMEDDFDERLTGFECRVDDGIASVWAPYVFYFEGEFSHCGTNAFQLIKVHDQWKISQITDTRRKVDCYDPKFEEAKVDSIMNAWHRAAAAGDEDRFFGAMTADAVYIGTDPTERWLRDELRLWSKPYFDKDSAWDFTPVSRHITLDGTGQSAVIDELLDTWMGPCRSTALLRKTEGAWKITYYHLSVSVLNERMDEYLKVIPGK